MLEQLRAVAIRLGEPLLDRREDSLQVHEQLVVDQTHMDVARNMAHAFLLEQTPPPMGVCCRAGIRPTENGFLNIGWAAEKIYLTFQDCHMCPT